MVYEQVGETGDARTVEPVGAFGSFIPCAGLSWSTPSRQPICSPDGIGLALTWRRQHYEDLSPALTPPAAAEGSAVA
jgi:hypothetical protein